jgi:hemerythrin superfamily protein
MFYGASINGALYLLISIKINIMAQRVKRIKRIAFGIMVSLLKGFINAVPDAELERALKVQFEQPLTRFGQVLTDNDPNDVEQIKKVWKEINGDFQDASIENIKRLIEVKVGNEEVREILTDILTDYQENETRVNKIEKAII